MSSIIPKLIIQTGKSRNLPIHAKAAVATIRLLNPSYDYLFFEDKDVAAFLETHFPEYHNIFYSFPYPIQRFDFFRYLAVYRFGGFYFDLDVFLANNLDGLLDSGCVFPFEELTTNDFFRRAYGMDWEVGNYAFGAAAEHPFLGEVIKNCIKAQENPKWTWPMIKSIPAPFRERYRVLCTTGPGLVSRTLAEFPGASEQVKILFPEDVCDRSFYHHFGPYGVHLMEGTWLRHQSPFISRLTRVWERRKMERVIAASQKAGPGRSLSFKRST